MPAQMVASTGNAEEDAAQGLVYVVFLLTDDHHSMW